MPPPACIPEVLSLTNQVKRFKLPWVTASSAAIGCIIAVLHAETVFMPFLAILGVAFPPVAAVKHSAHGHDEIAGGSGAAAGASACCPDIMGAGFGQRLPDFA